MGEEVMGEATVLVLPASVRRKWLGEDRKILEVRVSVWEANSSLIPPI